MFQERQDPVFAEIGAEGDCTGIQRLEGRLRIGRRGRGDVAALGVEYHRHVARMCDHIAQGIESCPAPDLEEGAVRLEAEGFAAGRVDQPEAMVAHRSRIGEPLGLRVEPDTQQAVDCQRPPVEALEEVTHALPRTIASTAMRTYMPYSICRK